MNILWPTLIGFNVRALYGIKPPALEMSDAQAERERIMAKSKGKSSKGKGGKGTGKKGC